MQNDFNYEPSDDGNSSTFFKKEDNVKNVDDPLDLLMQ
jgi:hypothetical protein